MMNSRALITACAAFLACVAISCGDSASSESSLAAPAEPLDFEATEDDFDCIQDWERVRNIRVTNKLGFLEEALALARDPEKGEQFPVGTIIQLFPGEAMVKRGSEFDPNNNNWEYFELAVTPSGTSINVRGRDEVINMFGGQCFNCHLEAKDFDFLCEKGRGCIELPIDDATITALQEADPRCN